jgi:hypothetical protein
MHPISTRSLEVLKKYERISISLMWQRSTSISFAKYSSSLIFLLRYYSYQFLISFIKYPILKYLRLPEILVTLISIRYDSLVLSSLKYCNGSN